MSDQKRGHTLTITIDNSWSPGLNGVCHETTGAVCRLNCPDGCESWNTEGHEHELVDYGKCIAVEWWDSDGMGELFMGENGTHISDGMAITPTWDGDCWGWTVTPKEAK